jgi:hypothetical protein
MAIKTITTELAREGRTFGRSIPPWLIAVRAVTGTGRTGDVVGDEVRANGYLIAHLTETGRYAEICGKCGGSGHLPEYGGINAGSCYPCAGNGLHLHKDGSLKELVKILDRRKSARERAARKAEAKQAAERATLETWKAENPGAAQVITAVLADMDEAGRTGENFGAGQYDGNLRELAMRGNLRILTDVQAAFMVTLYREHHERKASKERAAAARQWLGTVKQKITITGQVIYINQFEGKFGWSTLYLIKDEAGNTAKWYRNGWHQGSKGDTVTVTATIKTLDESEEHGKLTVITRGTVHQPQV